MSTRNWTLRDHLNRPFTTARDMSNLDMANGLSKLKLLPELEFKKPPEAEAIDFYLGQHVMALIQQKFSPDSVLPKAEAEFVNDYYSCMNRSAIRMFYYLLCICTREARHNSGKVYAHIDLNYGAACRSFLVRIKGSNSSTAVERLFSDGFSEVSATLGQWALTTQYVFYNGKFSSGYGGPAWGAIADVLVGFVFGKLSPVMMLDTAFTLAHNNGPIFNKGLVFQKYGSGFKELLDIQAAGQIPNLLNEPNSEHGCYVSHRAREWLSFAVATGLIPADQRVDWMQVAREGKLSASHYKHKYGVADMPTEPEPKGPFVSMLNSSVGFAKGISR